MSNESTNQLVLSDQFTQFLSIQSLSDSLILDAIPFGVIIVDKSGLIKKINQAGAELLGFPDPAEILLQPVTNFFVEIPGESQKEIPTDRKPGRAEFIAKPKSGEEFPALKSSLEINLGGEIMRFETFVNIAEQKRKLTDLAETQRQYTTLIDNLPGVVYRCANDHERTMEFISDSCRDLTGYEANDIIHNNVIPFRNLIHPEDQERIYTETQENLLSKKPFTLDYRIIHSQGKIIWILEKTKGIFNAEGELLYFEGFLSDVSETRNAKILQEVVFMISAASYISRDLDEFFLAIHKSLGQIIDVENFYIAMYDRGNDSISLPYQVDAQDRITSFPAGKTLTGYVIRTEKALLATKTIIHDLARKGHVEIVGTPAMVWLGVPLIVENNVTGVIAVQSYTDQHRYTSLDVELLTFVADQIATVILRKTAEDSLLQEKAQLEQLFESSPEALILVDNSGKVMKINSEFSKLFGFHKDEILGRNIDDMISDPENLKESTRITADISQGSKFELETKRRHKDGHLIDVSLLVTPIFVQGKIYGGYGIYRDITSRKSAEKALIAAKEKAEGADKLKSSFLANMSHEIRTPMNAILGFSALLNDPGLNDAEREEFINIIKDRGNDLMRIIDDIIDISKIESGQISFEIIEFPVNMLMNNLLITLNEVKRKLGKTKITLNCFPGNLNPDFKIMTDGNRLRQIMTNLIENAMKFTEEGHIDFGYVLKPEGTSPTIEFFVRDTGIGIPKDMHGIIFERFRQVEETATRRFGGTGLGLTISRNLTRLLGGEIWLDSDKGKGTTFYVGLPLLSSKLEEIKPVSPKPSPASLQKWQNKVIMIVEDEESNYFLLSRLLKNTGVKISWARNGREAIDFCRNQVFDLILMDIRMPIMDGYETTKALRSSGNKTPIIAQTAYALKGEREKSLEAGCNNYIAKPIDISELLTILGIYLNR